MDTKVLEFLKKNLHMGFQNVNPWTFYLPPLSNDTKYLLGRICSKT